jgi:hypothetical protein
MTSAEPETLQAWYAHVRNMHRNKRLGGLAGCAVAIGILMYAKFTPDAPPWMIGLGLAIAGVSFITFIYVFVARLRWVNKHPYKGPVK